MTALREIRPPGVYPAGDEVRARPLSIADTRICGFIGLAAKGPLDEPRRISSWDEFVDTYGFSQDGYLARGVEGFFLNGGKCCYVVRVAHRARQGEVVGPDHASCAERIIKDGWDKPTLLVRALNEGRWGNAIWVRFAQTTSAKTLLTLDLDVGAGEARVNSARGFERGALVRIYDRENADYVVLTEVDDRTLRWSASTPIVRRYRAAGPTYLEVLEFEVFASLKDRREAFRGLQLSPLSRRYVGRVVNEQSQLIRIEDLHSAAPSPHNLPQAAPAAKLTGGRDGADVEEVAMLACPDAMVAYQRHPGPQADRDVQRIQDAMVDVCENLQDRFAVLDIPPTKDIETVKRWRRRVDSSFAAFYYPWLFVGGERVQTESVLGQRDPVRGMKVPPSGHVAGIFARCDTQRGCFKAPANEVLNGTHALTLALSDDHLGQLNAEGINTMRSFPGRGIRVWGARTASDSPEWRYVNVRRLFIMLRRSITEGSQWAVFEPNSMQTWDMVQRLIHLFLRDQWKAGAFSGDSEDEAFFVKCDDETNPPAVRDNGQMIVEIGVAPALPAEFIIFTVTQNMGDQAADEAPAA
jgi:hypothetical protein